MDGYRHAIDGRYRMWRSREHLVPKLGPSLAAHSDRLRDFRGVDG
jgi:hypothetical protein